MFLYEHTVKYCTFNTILIIQTKFLYTKEKRNKIDKMTLTPAKYCNSGNQSYDFNNCSLNLNRSNTYRGMYQLGYGSCNLGCNNHNSW